MTESEKQIETIGIIGLGAVGIMYAELFGKAFGKEKVFIIADTARIERYRHEGVYANGKRCDFQYVEAENAPQVDLLIFATKFYGLQEAMKSAVHAIGKETIVMSFLNGVTSEQIIEETLHPGYLLYCTVQGMDATKEGNCMTYVTSGSVTFGEKDNHRSESVCRVERLFQKAGISYLIPQDILQKQWSKWMFNVGLNQSCAVYGVDYGGVQKEGEPRTAMLLAMEEARCVASAAGITLTVEELKEWVQLINSFSPTGEPSMRQDTKAGRETEVELFSGVVRALGKQYGISTPYNDFLYEKLTGSV